MKLLAFSASLRSGSFNRKLVDIAAKIAKKHGAHIDVVDFREFEMPLYDGDEDHQNGLPPGAQKLRSHIDRVDGLIIAAPEYNYSISGPLKNAIDWVSRARPMPWRGKSIYLMSASPSAVGGIRGLWQTRIPLEGCGALVFPDMFSLASAHEAFDSHNQLKDFGAAERLDTEIRGFCSMTEALLPVCGKVGTRAEKARQKEIIAALEDESQLQPS